MRLRHILHAAGIAALAIATPAWAGGPVPLYGKDKHHAKKQHRHHGESGPGKSASQGHAMQRHGEMHERRTPAVHDGHRAGGESVQSGSYDGTWRGQWTAPDGRVYEGMYTGMHVDPNGSAVPVDYAGRWEGHGGPTGPYNGPAPHGGAGYDHDRYGAPGYGDAGYGPPTYDGPGYGPGGFDRQAWFEDCMRRGGASGLAGAVVGGTVGGVVGNRVAGRNDRTLGTILGAGVGAVAGAAIERGVVRDQVRDQCEAALDGPPIDYAAGPPPLPGQPMPAYGTGGPGYASGGSGYAAAERVGRGPGHGVAVASGPVHGGYGYGHYGYAQAGYAHPGYAHTGYPIPAPAPGYGAPGYGYPAPMMMVPVITFPAAQAECKETVTEIVEWVDAPKRRTRARR